MLSADSRCCNISKFYNSQLINWNNCQVTVDTIMFLIYEMVSSSQIFLRWLLTQYCFIFSVIVSWSIKSFSLMIAYSIILLISVIVRSSLKLFSSDGRLSNISYSCNSRLIAKNFCLVIVNSVIFSTSVIVGWPLNLFVINGQLCKVYSFCNSWLVTEIFVYWLLTQ